MTSVEDTMKNISQVILLSTSCLIWYGADNVCASVNVFSGIPKSGTHNTLHTTPYLAYPHLPSAHPRGVAESSPRLVPSAESAMLTSCLPEESNRHIRVASVCFITDTGACSGEKFSNDETPGNGSGNPGGIPDYDTPQEQCRDAGYTQSPCPEGSSPIPCPADPSYHICSCADEYNKTCEKPYYGIGDSCGGQYKQCEKDTERACREENPEFTNYCQNGWQMGNEKCSYDPTFGICCNTCVGYNYTKDTVPDGYVTDGEPCLNCSGNEVYKIEPNPCNGFQDCGSIGPESGAQSCLSGTVTKYDNCNPCPNQGKLTSCPTGYKCEYEDCSNKYYKVDGCQSGYDWNAAAKTCTEHCDYKCSLNSCPANADCDYEACSGKYCFNYCKGTYEEQNGKCACPLSYNLDTCPPYSICDSCDGKYRFYGCHQDYILINGKCTCPNTCYLNACPDNAICSKEFCSGKYCITGCQGRYELDSQKQQCTCEPLPIPEEQGTPKQHTCWSGLTQQDDGCGNKKTICSKSEVFYNDALKYVKKEDARCIKVEYTNETRYEITYTSYKVYCYACPEYPMDYYSSFKTDKNDSFNTMEECEAQLATQSETGIVDYVSFMCTKERCWETEASQTPEEIPDFASMTYLRTLEYTNTHGDIKYEIEKIEKNIEQRSQYEPY